MKEYFKDKKGFWHTLFYEVLCTWSNEKSFFASKRIERSIMFAISMWVVIGYVIRKWQELTVDNVLMLGGFLLGFGAWNAVQLRKDKQIEHDKTIEPPKE